ncbi:MAG: Helicase PriA essential for oriC/DnaA-independent DNA replication [uncultured Gemmatimonadetes bacterium]|uniref:Replication restart protein PriA n=1 Tax=uncultured Gemmatimonadota bacterium TaxID=203437 RepID=A0A6J4M058_9BACT|nr:MAG: Helicase PriA essential for oriC/DnaA-independent DNA replication [uncultured Gemmatimonadota bacterium]
MFVEVALPLPLPRTFTYRVPDELRPAARPGARVLVPFAGKEKIGWIDRVATGEPAGKVERIKPITGVLDEAPSATPVILKLSRWIADYYLAPLGQVLRTALPAGLTESTTDYVVLAAGAAVHEEGLSPQEAKLVGWLQSRDGPQPVARLRREMGDRAWWPVIRRLTDAGVVEVVSEGPRTAPPVRTRRVVRLVRHVPSLLEREELFSRAKRQREAYEMLEAMAGQAELSHLTGTLGFSSAIVKGLVEKGLASVTEEEVSRDPYANIEVGAAPKLRPTPQQAEIIRRLSEASRTREPGTFLLRGVTGSGKTLVYIELLREVVERQGKTAIVLVPEIALTPQTVGRFKAVFGDRVAVLHSALSDGERYDEWRSLRAGEKQIVVGARSAVFAPLANLGAIVVDEEHESSYKQADAPRYHAREVAVVRARLEGAVCLLGSATPALESWTNAQSGKYQLVELPERVGGQPLPPIRIVDLRKERKRQKETAGPLQKADMGPIILSDVLVDAVHARMRLGEQTILLLNRRGYASFVQCRDCGFVWHCPNCNVSLTFHRRRGLLTCHYCLHEEPSPKTCTACGSADLSFRGVGTEQVERSVGEAFPSARIARMDVDTTGGKWAHHDILGRVERGEVDILLGTQMIAKGLDFPNVTLVGVINADVGINLPDFRATERTFQLLTQVAGRAGRGPKGGEVFIQTALPSHYAIESATEHDFVGFAARELEARREPTYPPHSRLVNVVLSGLEEPATQELAVQASEWLAGLLSSRGLKEVALVGPAPCPIDRIRNRWRWHFLLRSENSKLLGEVARYFYERFDPPKSKADLRIALDRDPVALL